MIMKLKLSTQRDPKHLDMATCLGWVASDELYTSGDDHKVYKWYNNESTLFMTLPAEVYPTDMHWFPKGSAGGKKQLGSELFVLTSTDGMFHLISKVGRFEKSTEAHKGATLSGRWSHDGTALATSGEDGLVKVWSRSGMLRSTLAQNSSPIYSVAWGPDSDEVLFTCARQLVIKPLQPNSKPTVWKAHDGIILAADWNPINYLIISGGEDCKYKIWDRYGVQSYTTTAYEYPITSLSWTPNGELFAVGSFNTLRLCDKTGWSYALEKSNTGSVLALAWSLDSTMVAGTCSSGKVIFAHLTDKRLEYKGFEATMTESQTIRVRNVSNDAKDKLDFRDRIIKSSFGFDHLVVATSSQCYIYSTRNFNTPMIFDLKEGSVTCIIQCCKYFGLVDNAGVYVYSYEGRLISTPRYSGMRSELLSELTFSLSDDTVAIRDKSDEKTVYLFETQNGRAVGDGKPITHCQEILQIGLDCAGQASDRRIAFIDKNRDLFITSVRTFGGGRTVQKLSTMISSFAWNDGCNVLAGMSDSKLVVWLYPNVVFTDADLLTKSVIEIDSREFGKNLHLTSFVGTMLTMRRHDGALVNTSIPPYPAALHAYVQSSKWEDAVHLCRFVKDQSLWACLAVMAANAKNLITAEVAYAAINRADKVQYLHETKEISNQVLRDADMAVFCGNIADADGSLVNSGQIFRAIMLNIQLFNWDRALDLAIKHKTHVDTVLGYRERYLQRLGRKENNKRFLQYSESVKLDWEKIEQKVDMEYQKSGMGDSRH